MCRLRMFALAYASMVLVLIMCRACFAIDLVVKKSDADSAHSLLDVTNLPGEWALSSHVDPLHLRKLKIERVGTGVYKATDNLGEVRKFHVVYELKDENVYFAWLHREVRQGDIRWPATAPDVVRLQPILLRVHQEELRLVSATNNVQELLRELRKRNVRCSWSVYTWAAYVDAELPEVRDALEDVYASESTHPILGKDAFVYTRENQKREKEPKDE